MDKLTEKSEYQVPMDGEEREVSRSNSETFSYVVHFTYRRETVSNNKKAKTEFIRERREKKDLEVEEVLKSMRGFERKLHWKTMLKI